MPTPAFDKAVTQHRTLPPPRPPRPRSHRRNRPAVAQAGLAIAASAAPNITARCQQHRAGRAGLRLGGLLAGAGLAAALILAVPAQAGATSITETYSMAATETTTGAPSPPPNLLIDCFNSDLGYASCPASAAGTLYPPNPVFPPTPVGGAYTLGVTSYTTTSAGCAIKKLTGDLSVTWSDSHASFVTFTGAFKDSHPVLALKGKVSASSTDFAGWEFTATINGLPPNPCTPSTNAITGTFTFYPPNPI
jgi:hypothetical protein